MTRLRRHSFTLMEVMIAATILAVSVAGTMAIVGSARSGLLRAENRWGRQHLLSNVMELYLVGGPYAEIPADLLPQGYSATCELIQVEDIHEEALEPIDGWILGEFHVTVYDVSGNVMAECRVRKVLKDEDWN